MATRGSIETGDRRLFSTRSLTTCLAVAKAVSVASLLPNIRRKALLPAGLSSHTLRASGLAASSMLTSARSRSSCSSPRLGRVGLGGILDVDQRRQRLVVDLDQLGGVAGLRQGLGDDEGDAVADM